MRHMLLLNVEFAYIIGFSIVTFRPSRVFHSCVFSRPGVDTDEQSTGSCPLFTKHSKCCDDRADNVFVCFYFASL